MNEIVLTGIKRQHCIERVIGTLPTAEIAAKQSRSINYRQACPGHGTGRPRGGRHA